MEIKFSDLWLAFRRSWIVVLICGILAGGISFLYTKTAVQKVYSTNISLIMVYTEDRENMTLDEYSKSVAVANAISPSVLSVLGNEVVAGELLRRCAGRLDYDYSVPQLRSMIRAGYDPVTEDVNYHLCFQVQIQAYSAADCGTLAACMRDNVNAILEEYLAGGMYELQPYSYVYSQGTQIAPNATKGAVLWAAVGLLVPYLAALVYTLLDRRIYTDEDLRRAYEKAQILGQIPTIQ